MSADFNAAIARMQNSAPYGDTLMAGFFGTQAHVWGDQALNSVGAAIRQEPESLAGGAARAQIQRLYSSVGAKKKTQRLCGGSNCPPPADSATPIVNLQITKQGDVSLSDRSFNVGETNIPDFNIPGFDFSGLGGGNFNFGDTAEGDDYAQNASWNPFANDCESVCAEFERDPEAYRLCKNDCEKSNAQQAAGLPWGTDGIKTIMFLAVGIILLAAGLNALTRG